MAKVPAPAKVTRPKPRGVLARPRLARLLDEARKRRIVWITAPPGAGKTTLVSDYLEQRDLKNVWYQVDEGDADFASLPYYLGLAGGNAATRTRKPLPQLTPEHRSNLGAFFRLFFRELFGRWKAPHALVFDNYQEIPESAAFHDAVLEALRQLPAGSNIIVLSRSDPPAVFARARVNGLLAHIDWERLKLTPGEAGRLVDLKKKRGALSPALRKNLYSVCDGWVTGLLLMLETLTMRDAAEPRLGKVAPQVLFDYFGSQSFDRMDLRAKRILVHSAFLPKMTLQAVQKLSGVPHAGRVIQDLHRRNYFIVRQGDDPPVYQYHPLFRTFLLNRAPEMFGSARLNTLIQRAAALLAESGQFEDAVNLYCQIEDEPGVIGVIVQHAPSLMKQGRSETILSWIHALSEETAQRMPWVLYWLGVCNIGVDVTKSRTSLGRALQLFDAEQNPAGAYLSWSAIVNSILYGFDDIYPLDPWIDMFEGLQARHGDFPSLDIEIQVVSSMFAALLFRRPRHPRIGFWEERLQALLLSAAAPALIVLLGVQLLNYCVWFGYFSKARLLVDFLDSHVRKPSTPAAAQLFWGVMGAAYYWSVGEYDTASRVVRENREIAEKLGLQSFVTQISTQQVHVHLARGDFQAAAAALKEVSGRVTPARRFDFGHYHFLVSMNALFQGELVLARENIQVSLRAGEECGAAFPQLANNFGAAQVAFAEGDYEKAARHVAQGRKFMSSVTVDYFCLLFEARLAFTRSDEAGGLRFLGEALTLGKQHGIVHYPWWSPAAMTDFYVKALDAGLEVPYVRSVIRKRKLVPHIPPTDVEAWPFPVKIYTLGRLSVLIDGKPLQFTGKAQRKPLELLMALVAFGGRDVSERQLTEALWPDAEGDAAHQACAVALHRLRKLLACEQAIGLQRNHFSLNPHYVWVDIWAFERGLAPERGKSDEARAAASDKALALYHGPFLAKQEDLTWAIALRERLRTKFIRHVAEQGRSLSETKQFASAIAVFEKGLDVDALAEELYRNLMLCYQAQGRRAEAIGVYQRCEKTLAATLGMPPAPKTVALYQTLQN